MTIVIEMVRYVSMVIAYGSVRVSQPGSSVFFLISGRPPKETGGFSNLHFHVI